VASDSSATRLHGQSYPIIKDTVRAEMISYLAGVDFVTIVDQDRAQAVLMLLQPDVFFVSDDSIRRGIVNASDRALTKMYGGRIVVRRNQAPYFSTNDFVEYVADIRVMQILENYLKGKIPHFDADFEDSFRPLDFGSQIPNNRQAFDARDKIIDFEMLEELGISLKSEGKRVVFVSGSYDILHVGHARFIEQAGLLGDILVVGIPSDASIRKSKGVGRPVISQNSRAQTLAYLDSVDFVTIFDTDSVYACLEKLRPDVFYTVNEEWNKGYKESSEYKLVKSYKGKVVLGERQTPNISASLLIDKAAYKKVTKIFEECMDVSKYEKILSERSRLNGK